ADEAAGRHVDRLLRHRVLDLDPGVVEGGAGGVQRRALLPDAGYRRVVRGVEHGDAVGHLLAVADELLGDGCGCRGVILVATFLITYAGRREDGDFLEVLEREQAGAFAVGFAVDANVLVEAGAQAIVPADE